MTFSIVAWDPDPSPPEWGVAVASKFLAVGSAVPWAQAGAGAVATQALANLAYGPEGLALLASGMGAEEVVRDLTRGDAENSHRQVGIVDAVGRAATFTGSDCLHWAGGLTGEGYCCQGNILTGPDVVEAMAKAFEETKGELAARLLAALQAGDLAGGDSRGRQSAALYVVRDGGGYGGTVDRSVDLRVEDHPLPIPELKRLFDMHKLLFPRKEDLSFLEIDKPLADELRRSLLSLGYEPGEGEGYDAALREALYSYCGTENLEERWDEGERVERGVLAYLRDQASA